MSKTGSWMAFYTGDYLADTMHLTTLQHGAYMLLLMHYWRTGPLPDDDTRLAAIVRLTEKEWKRMAATVKEFFMAENGQLRQKRADFEIAKQVQISSKRSKAARVLHMHNESKCSAHAGANAPNVQGTSTTQRRKKAAPARKAGADLLPFRAPDPLGTGMADLETKDGRPTVNGFYVDGMFDLCCREARMTIPNTLRNWQPVIDWLKAGYVEAEIKWLIRKLASRADYKPPQTLMYFTKAIQNDCTTGERPDGRPWHE